MAQTVLSHSEIIAQKKVTEEAIAKLLQELQQQTGHQIMGLTTTKFIDINKVDLKVSIFLNH